MSTLTIEKGTPVTVENADGTTATKTLTKAHSAPMEQVVADGWGMFVFPLKENSKGWLRLLVDPQYVQGMDEPRGDYHPATKSSVKDGTYTVVFNGDDDYVTIRFDTSTAPLKQDGTKNTWQGKQFVQFLRGPDNSSDFESFGVWDNGDVQVWGRYRNSVAVAKYVKAALIVAASEDPGKFGEAYALRSGKCCICGRKLTVPASLHRGMGPVCAEGGRDA